MRIYVASSWRNDRQPFVVAILRALGHEVYDFKNPSAGDNGFHWSEIDPTWRSWTPEQFREGLKHPLAEAGFKSDMEALQSCDLCVLVLPCGKSAHLELGQAVGAEKKTIILIENADEPELMYKMVGRVVTDIDELCLALLELEVK